MRCTSPTPLISIGSFSGFLNAIPTIDVISNAAQRTRTTTPTGRGLKRLADFGLPVTREMVVMQGHGEP